jgi:eukaryotic-like serine/threonine-protein kinase
MTPQTLKGIANDAVIGPGAVVGGRFEVRDLVVTLGSIPIYAAKDQKTQRPVALWMIPRGGLDDRAVEATRQAVRGAASVAHRDLVAAYGSAVLPSGVLAVATEMLPAESLADRMRARRAQGTGFSLEESWPTVTRLCQALSAAHASLAHGAVCPSMVRLDQGAVRLAGTGLVAPLVALGAAEMEFIAPEVRRGETPTVRSDIYSVGAILYTLLSGALPTPDVALSSRVEGVAATLDVILESCLSDDPSERFERAETLRAALEALVAPTARVPRDEADAIPVVFDLGDERLGDIVGDIPVVFDLDDDPLASLPPTAIDAQSTAELTAIIEAATANDSDRWIFSHGGLDHGPLTARDLIAAILRHEVLDTDAVVNMETDERRALKDWPQYQEFMHAAHATRTGAARSAATRVALADAQATRRGKMLIAGAALVSLSALGAVYYFTLGAGARRTRTAAEIDSLIARGEMRVQTSTVQLLPPPPPSARRSHSGGGGGGGGGGTSFESAMSAPIEFNMGPGGASTGTGTLRDDEITRPLNASLPRFAHCLGDGSARQVRLRIAIGGNGRAAGVSVDSGSGALRSCVAGVARSLQWRTFGGPRIGLSWSFGF